MSGYCRAVFDVAVVLVVRLAIRAQVNEGETQIINIRETDSRLGPLVFVLLALGAATLVATVVFWWLTSPRRNRHIGD